jgi:hypothetical protein
MAGRHSDSAVAGVGSEVEERAWAVDACNTQGVYIPLDNEYGFKPVISVNKTNAKF